MRTAFIETFTKLAKDNPNLQLLTGDLGFGVFEDFKTQLPNQYKNMGVSEQNMIGVAAGMALSGRIVFVYSIVPFVTLRALEQIRNDVCMQGANVKIVGVGEGFSYGQLGPTHHSIEDITIMRALPNMTVVCPGDPWEVEEAVKAIAKIKTPAYLRLGKKGESRLHFQKDKFVLGHGMVMRDGKDLTLISTGNMLESALVVWKKLAKKKLSARVISMHSVKPLDENVIIKSAQETGAIFTLEEHSVIGGLGSAVSQVLIKNGKYIKFHSFGINDNFTKMAGDQEFLRGFNGFSQDQIFKKILAVLT